MWDKQAKRILPLPNLLSTTNFMRSFNYFLLGILPEKLDSSSINNNFPILNPPKRLEINPDRNVIFIIGESLRARSLSILGYEKNTTPLLAKIDNLYVKSIFSAGTMTKSSVSVLLNRVKYLGTEQMTSQKNYLFHLAKQNGFTTSFFSAQHEKELNIIQNYMCKKYVDNYESKTSLITL